MRRHRHRGPLVRIVPDASMITCGGQMVVVEDVASAEAVDAIEQLIAAANRREDDPE